MGFICKNSDCSAPENKKGKAYPSAMECPFCDAPLEEVFSFSVEEINLLSNLPYVIAYPLKETLLQNDYEKRLHRLGYTFINFLKYLGLISISEFFNSDFKNRKIVDLFLSQLSEPSFGKWNAFIRESYAVLKKEKIEIVFPEFYDFYIQIENKDKKFNLEEEIIEDFGEINYSKKNGLSSIGMLIHFRNKYLGHGTPINELKAKELWELYYPIFQTILIKLIKSSESSLYKRENGMVWKLSSTVVNEADKLNQIFDEEKVWLADGKNRKLSMVPFFIIPSDFGVLKNETQLLVYESYTGNTIKFFSPENIIKETSGEILQRLNLLLRDKKKETPFTLETFTKEEFLKRIAEENQLLLDTLISEKKIIPGVYWHREEIEIKLREWIGARANIFFIVAEAGSGKTNLLVEIQKQYTERELPSLLIRACRIEKPSLKKQIAYLLNIDAEIGIENYTSIAGTQAQPTFILIDGLNEANNAEEIWQEIIDLSKLFEPGSLKFVITNRANTKAELSRYIISEEEQDLLFGENKDNETGLGAYAFWLTALDMKEMKGAWENYVTKDKTKFNPQFNFDAIADFDRGLYNQINNPLILRLFLEIYNGKKLPKKGVKHLNIWRDWFATFSEAEQTFFKLLTNEVWQKGENELLIDELLKHEKLKSYFISDIINAPYNRSKNNGWISRYVKDLAGYVGFTVEGALLYLLALQLQEQKQSLDLASIQLLLKKGSKLQKSAIESFLCEQALNGNLNIVADLIDAGNEYIDLCIKPLLLYLKTFGAEATIEKVLENPSENDWKALKKLDGQLNQLQLQISRKAFLKALMPKNELNTKEAVGICLNAIAIFDKTEAIDYLNKVDLNSFFILNEGSLLSQLGNCEKKFGNYDKALIYYEKSLAISLATLGGEHPDAAKSYNNIGQVWKSKGDYYKAIENYEKSLAIKLKTFGGEHPSVAISYNNIGGIWDIKGDYDKALEYYEKSLDIVLKTFGSEHPFVAISYNNIGQVWKSKGDYEKALEYYEKSLTIQLKTLGSEHSYVATSYNIIGQARYRIGRYEKALEYYEKSLEIRLKSLGLDHPHVAALYSDIAGIWNSKGEFNKALEFQEKCLKIYLKTLGDEHPWLAISYNHIGQIWKSKGDYDKALDFYEKCLKIRLKTLGGEHPDVATSYNNIGQVCYSKGDYEKALEYYEKCLVIKLKTFGGEHPDVATSYNNIGQVCYSKGDYEKALEYYEKCLVIKLKTLGGKHPGVAPSYNNIGLVWNSKGDYEKALEYYEKCLAIQLKTLGGEHPSVATTYNNIGLVWKNKGDYDKALYFYEKCLKIRIKTSDSDHPDVATVYNNIGQTLKSKGDKNKALEYCILSAQIRFKKLGTDHKLTINTIKNARRLAKHLGKEHELPEWMNEIN